MGDNWIYVCWRQFLMMCITTVAMAFVSIGLFMGPFDNYIKLMVFGAMFWVYGLLVFLMLEVIFRELFSDGN